MLRPVGFGTDIITKRVSTALPILVMLIHHNLAICKRLVVDHVFDLRSAVGLLVLGALLGTVLGAVLGALLEQCNLYGQNS